ncbi:5-(carboxyamino)imidazole ribonucleotide mutase [Tumebacillus sp. ITR2]|uniref:N5-carboxyaminoimidazole ribonucleotide mutase n=1 Tax=Tumebacillus amylolyticus TaxID=2801339 RepID=A0ABS1JG63_9BACL|nr:5-(carboxyamino)imidazole ribonucleotide mutase [Tumebacillus amylolyticus]MBL0389232.1 5-(carboxyamino)imidazole ribonucleotide mutase [Tumebacillus amylolyticus]
MAKKVLILMGSDSDLKIMNDAAKALAALEIETEVRISSAHRVPDKTMKLAHEAKANGFGAIIAGAGLAAHLPGVVAACTTLPVIGVPIQGGAINGIDALYAIVQMPKGIPVATVAVNGAYNAGLLAAQILAGADEALAERLVTFRENLAAEVNAKDDKLQEIGVEAYLSK